MSARPILFSGPMVRAILEGRKTQTRRIVKPQPDFVNRNGIPFWPGGRGPVDYRHCSYGKPGDRLWVRETWAPGDRMVFDAVKEDPETVLFRADLSALHWDGEAMATPLDTYAFNWKVVRWRPSIFMPRWASRITLEVVAVRVERLQDITPEDAIAEGIGHADVDAAIADYAALWDRINGPGSWAANPWVWVVEFGRLEGRCA